MEWRALPVPPTQSFRRRNILRFFRRLRAGRGDGSGPFPGRAQTGSNEADPAARVLVAGAGAMVFLGDGRVVRTGAYLVRALASFQCPC